MRFVVLHTIRAGAAIHRSARLLITDAPEKTTVAEMQSALEAAGKATDFSEAGVPWGNHEIKDADKSLPKGTVGADDAPTVTWDALVGSKVLRRITLRLEPADYDQIHRAARRSNQSIQVWCAQALRQAAIENKEQ